MEEENKIILNEYDYSNAIVNKEYISYVIKYLDDVFRNFINLIKLDEEKNDKLKLEYRNYQYKKKFSEVFEISIKTKNYNIIRCNSFSEFEQLVKLGNLDNINELDIRLCLDYKSGLYNSLVDYNNLFDIKIKPYDIKFIRKSNHKEESINQIENNIDEMLKKFPTINTIFCTKE